MCVRPLHPSDKVCLVGGSAGRREARAVLSRRGVLASLRLLSKLISRRTGFWSPPRALLVSKAPVKGRCSRRGTYLGATAKAELQVARARRTRGLVPSRPLRDLGLAPSP